MRRQHSDATPRRRLYHPREAREGLGKKCMEMDIADPLGNAGRTDQIEKEDGKVASGLRRDSRPAVVQKSGLTRKSPTT
jgi:hypothetical protein